MKVLHIIAEIVKARGGPVSAMAGIIEVSELLGIQSSVLTIQREGVEHSLPDTVTIHRSKVSFPVRFLRSVEALGWLEQHWREFDLIVLHEIWALMILESGVFLAGKRANYTVMPHCSLDPYDLRKKRTAKALLGRTHARRMLDGARCIVTATTLEAERLCMFGAKPCLRTLPLPVIGSEMRGDGGRFRGTVGASASEFLILFLGRLDPKKGIDVLIRAFSSCTHDYPELRLVIAGGGKAEYEAELRALADRSGASKKIVFAGFLGPREREDAFAGSDVFALTSHYENYGMAVVEAMGSGLPVLISRGVFIALEIEDKHAGMICEDNDASVGSAIRDTLQNRKELSAFRERGLAYAKDLAPESLRGSYDKLFVELTSRPILTLS